jgi:branched-chain amino acid transport system permease protein
MFPEPISLRSPRPWLVAALLVLLALVPVYAQLVAQPFYVTQFGRILIYAIAACSLNLLIGYTGLVSFGHALYLGLGAYAVGILSFHGITNGWLQLLVAVVAGAAVAFATGLVVLRTSGIAFIMITLAFTQMFYYLGVSLKNYGGDDGIRLDARSSLAPFDLASNTVLYYLCLALLLALLYFSWRMVHARLGFTLRGIHANERRLKALGFSTLRYKLAIYVLAGCCTAVAGVMLANHNEYTSPAYSAWTVSGELIVMVVLGGMGTVIGPLVGALALLLVEEMLSSLTQHWMAPLGLAIVAVVLFAKRGLYGSFHAWATRREREARHDD